jgi:hypothetical protein
MDLSSLKKVPGLRWAQKGRRLGRWPVSDPASNFVPQPVTGEIAPKRSAGRRKRQPQERQHSADAETAAGRGTDCSRETG